MCEPKAREYYGFNRDLDVAEIGLIYRDTDHMVAASPDGLAGDDGLIEIKCPSPKSTCYTSLAAGCLKIISGKFKASCGLLSANGSIL